MFEGREYLISDLKYLKLNISFPHDEAYDEIVNLKNKCSYFFNLIR